MATIGIYDYDFFTYEHAVPNLECAKLVTYYRNHNQIAVLSPTLTPERFTHFIIRKEYDDYKYPRELFLPNCEYGGRAFQNGQYKALAPDIEATVPDMHIYDRYIDHFGYKNADKTQISRILNCAHMRLSMDGTTLPTAQQFSNYFYKGINGIFLHDYDLAALKAYDLIKELQDQRHYRTRLGIHPYPVGNKYPIIIYNNDEMVKWCKIETIPGALFLEYRGLMSSTTLYTLCNDNKRMAKQIYYNVTYGCKDEEDFLINRLPKIFIQVLFLRRVHIKLLLKYDEGFLITPELKKLIELLNCWLSFTWQEGFYYCAQTLYAFCRSNSYLHYTSWAFQSVTVTNDESRDLFQYIRENNYHLFKMFYELDAIIYQGGKFVDEWGINSITDQIEK